MSSDAAKEWQAMREKHERENCECGEQDPHVAAASCVVSCDENCGAPKWPELVDDTGLAFEMAYTHWRKHRWCSGCAHGC